MKNSTRQESTAVIASSGSQERVGANVAGFAYSYAITSLVSAVLVVLKETSAGIHDFMAALSGHHWVTHGIFNIVLFLVLGWALSRTDLAKNATANSVINAVIGSTIVSGLIIAGFFGL